MVTKKPIVSLGINAKSIIENQLREIGKKKKIHPA